MCGIAGIFGKQVNKKDLDDAVIMRDTLSHRGPDAEGIWVSDKEDIVLVHRRLSILDLSDSGKQPMISGGQRYVISYNGEIYNYKELAAKLESEKNISFVGTSDTEVLLCCFEEYGIDKTLELAEGMFAIALYDRKEQILSLVRDRMGEKPLYYGCINNHFVFASEIKCLEKISYKHLSPDRSVVNEFVCRGYISGNKTMYQGIYKLRPGEIICLDKDSHILRQNYYWSYKDAVLAGKKRHASLSLEDAGECLEKILIDTVSKQMLSDVPLGAFLSSGIDSSLVVAIMQSLSGARIKTFSIGVEGHAMDEAGDARKIAEYLGTDHTELYITEQDAKEYIPLLPEIYSEPFGDPSAIPTLLVSRLAKKKVSVSLTGDGGDELFGGYPFYHSLPRKWRILKRIPHEWRIHLSKMISSNSRLLEHEEIIKRRDWLLAPSIEGLYDIMRYGTENENRWCEASIDNDYMAGMNEKELKNISEIMMYYDAVTYLPEDILVKTDRAAMTYSLETRAPFLDKNIVQFAAELGSKHKIHKGNGKIILKKILYRYVPQELICQRKKGFSIPISTWLREDQRINDWARGLLDSQKIKAQGILDADMVHRVWKEYVDNGKYSVKIWNLLMFEAWCENKNL